MNIDYTLWPNTDGNLGNIKVQIPDGVNTFWPEGDALVHNFVYKDGKLAGFVDTKALTVNESKSTIINYDYFDIELPFAEGEIAITRGERSKYFNVRYSVSKDDNVVITLKYKGCKTVDDVKAVDPDYLTNDIVDGVWSEGLGDLEDGTGDDYYGGFTTSMFWECSNLTTFHSNLSNLTNGRYMFAYCENLSEFSSDLSSLMDGTGMFCECFELTSFSSDLSSLTDSGYMFFNCTNLTSFNADLSSLRNGRHMFHNCQNLSKFNSNLSNLAAESSCDDMFTGCKLDTASVQNIADTINTPLSKRTIHIGIGNSAPNEQEIAAFNKIASKNWTVYVGVNGGYGTQWNPTSLIPIDGEEQQTPIPFWAKPVPSDEEHAQYVDENGNFYNILGGNYIYGDDLSNYGMFTSEEDAAANMRLTKYVKPVEKA